MADITPGDFSRNDVLKLARLARIGLDEAEVDDFTREFAAILTYVEQLQAVSIDGLEPTSQVTGLTNVMRPDVPKDYGYKVKDLLTNVPDVESNHIKVKRMIG
jgi:aspartyl-tRNA(Asn)/glutamyl-tRNA(Gln) amidotransferase subunit C